MTMKNKFFFPLSLKSLQHEQSQVLPLCCSGTMTKCWPVLEKPPPQRLWFIFHAAFPTVLTLAVKLQMMLLHAMDSCVPYAVSSPVGNEHKLPLSWVMLNNHQITAGLLCLRMEHFVEECPGLCQRNSTKLPM